MRMIKLFLLLLPGLLLAQSVPNGTIIQGQIWTPAQWNAAWQSKADVGQTRILSAFGANCDGVTDSRAAVVTAFAAVAGTSETLVIDCPVKISIGTNYANSIFVASGTNLAFVGSGAFVVDNIGTPVFVFENSSNSTWTNTQLQYKANFGILATLPTLAPFSPQNQINSIGILNYLTTNGSNTFTSGGLPLSATSTNNCSLIMIRGASNNLNFNGGLAAVPAGVAASNFIPMVFSVTPEWNIGLTGITSGTSKTTANTTIPSNITIAGWTFDGTYMGIQGGATNLVVKDLTSLRYSNLQDGTNGSVTFTGALSSGATTGTLSSAWTFPTGTYGLSFPMGATTGTSGTGSTATITYSGSAAFTNGTLINVTNVLPIGYNGWHVVTASSAGSVSFASSATGSQTHVGIMAQFSFVPLTLGSTATGAFAALGGTATSATAVSGNTGGYGFWFSPPHLLYLDSTAGQSISYATSFRITGVKDLGPYTGIALRPSTGYGTYLSFKVEPSNNTVIDGYTSLRPDGITDILSFGTSGGVIRNVYGVFDSSTATIDGSTIWGVRWPSAHPYIDMVLENITVIDSAITPTQFPINGLTATGTNSISVRNLKVFVNDYPVGATYNPTFLFVGNNLSIQADVFFLQCNSAQQGRGVFQNQGLLVTDSNFDITVHGWREPTVTFTAPLSIGATTGTLASNWLLETGTWQVVLSDNEIVYALLTNGSTTVGTFSSALTANVTAIATAKGALSVDYAQYKQRIFLMENGLATGNFARVRDVSNGWEATVENGIQTEHWTQMWAGIPQGATFATPMTFPLTMAIDAIGYKVATNLNTGSGLTTIGVGWTGTPTALLAAQLATTSFTANPAFAPVSLGGANQTILLTPTAGSFGTPTTGLLQLSVRGTQMLGAN